MNLNINNRQISFKSGLTSRTIDFVNSTNVKHVETYFKNKGIKADFQGSKVIAACSQLTADIFKRLGLTLPTEIRAISYSNVFKKDSKVTGTCLLTSHEFVPGIKSEVRSVFFNMDLMKSIKDVNAIADLNKGHNATTHFLETFLHEFSHSEHFDRAYKKFGFNRDTIKPNRYKKSELNYDGLDVLQMIYKPLKGLSYITSKYISRYSKTDTLELVAEANALRISEALDTRDNSLPLPVKNPFMHYKKFSPAIEKLLKDTYSFINYQQKG